MTDQNGEGPEFRSLADMQAVADEMERNPHAEARFVIMATGPDDSKTFSVDGMQQLGQLTQLWAATRIKRTWERTHEPPRVMALRVRVEFSDDVPPPIKEDP